MKNILDVLLVLVVSTLFTGGCSTVSFLKPVPGAGNVIVIKNCTPYVLRIRDIAGLKALNPTPFKNGLLPDEVLPHNDLVVRVVSDNEHAHSVVFAISAYKVMSGQVNSRGMRCLSVELPAGSTQRKVNFAEGACNLAQITVTRWSLR